MADNKGAVRLTNQTLQQLKDKGFQYVLIKGYDLSKKIDYIQLNSFQLTPVKELPQDPALKEIYAPLDSEILLQWASSEESGIEAFIESPV
ncbi:MAG TPA: hypothetical protein VHW43_06035 [Puia sp.]|jgi:hypothetical protein|nr:hypothetical protein [Puia sp.]